MEISYINQITPTVTITTMGFRISGIGRIRVPYYISKCGGNGFNAPGKED
jgi:hypothetical protein